MLRTSWPLLLRDPIFQSGLAVRLLLIVLAVPATYAKWFVPFLQHAAAGNPLDPWGAHLAQSGDANAFPYGLIMYVVMLPSVTLGTLVERLTGLTGFASIGFGLTILAFDLTLLALLLDMKPVRPRRLIVLYWLSPIVIFICYWHGQLDIVPVVLLVLSLLLIFRQHPASSGAFMAAAVSAKLSMALAPPIVLLYLASSNRRHALLLPYIAAGAAASVLLHLPVLLSKSAHTMVFGTPELGKIYDFSIKLSDGLEIYFVLVIYLLLLFTAWLIRRIGAELLTALLGLAFLIVVLMTPASPGWYLWIVPFLVMNFVMARLRIAAFVIIFSCLFVSFHLLRSTGAFLPLPGWDLTAPWGAVLAIERHMLSIWLSLLFASGLILCALLVREGVFRNDYFRISRRPLVIGIAGDSGSGKDKLVESVTGFIGAPAVTHISGDDYHRWDRHKPMWQVMTHLNPSANDLIRFKQDLSTLSGGMWIQNPHYDHVMGRMTKPKTTFSNEVIIASGLHALYDTELCARYDVRIFLDMDENLRRFLKVQRDVYHRGYAVETVLSEMERRRSDRERFISTQARHADLVFTLSPLRPNLVIDTTGKAALPRLKLRVQLAHDTPYEHLVRTLVGISGLHVEVVLSDPAGRIDITLEGDVDAEDVEMATRKHFGLLDEVLSIRPVWEAGPTGLMQLFVVNQIAHALRKRLT